MTLWIEQPPWESVSEFSHGLHDALLSEGSVVGAAQRLNLSAPATSRQLSRIRHLLGDPVLVRAGRGLVPTPRAEALGDRLRGLVTEAEALVRGENELDLARLERTFVIRAYDGFVGTFGAALAALAAQQAPQVRLRFAHQDKEGVEALREGGSPMSASSAPWGWRSACRHCSTIVSSVWCAPVIH